MLFSKRCGYIAPRISLGDAEAIRSLAMLGHDVDCQDAQGATPGHAAARGGHLDAVQALSDLGANFGEHAMWIVVVMLMLVGICLSAKIVLGCLFGFPLHPLIPHPALGDGACGRSPLFDAAAFGHESCVRLLARLGNATPNRRNGTVLTVVTEPWTNPPFRS